MTDKPKPTEAPQIHHGQLRIDESVTAASALVRVQPTIMADRKPPPPPEEKEAKK